MFQFYQTFFIQEKSVVNGIEQDVFTIPQISAIIRYYYRINPDELSDEDFAKYWAEWLFIQELESKKKNNNLEY